MVRPGADRPDLPHRGHPEPARRTAAQDSYQWLKAWAYLLRTEKNADLIAEIDGGIKKEVSVGCSMGRSVCSICGAESGTCTHVRGQTYDGKLCFAELKDPTDAYEWSFVAVPAQRSAGVVKHFGPERDELSQLRRQAEMGQRYLQALRREVVRLAMLADDDLDGTIFSKAAQRLEEPELLDSSGSMRPALPGASAPNPSCAVGMVLMSGKMNPHSSSDGRMKYKEDDDEHFL